jgi:hypothetical protein
MTRPESYRRPIVTDGDIVWLPISVVALMYSRSAESIRLWCIEGYIIQLGYRVRRECRGQWRIGIPVTEYSKFSNAQVATLQ